MGDIIDLVTQQDNKIFFYKISSSGLSFEVQAANCAAIGLAKAPGHKCDIWVLLVNDTYNQLSCIMRHRRDRKIETRRTPNILSGTEYRRFWLTWRSGCIQLGRGDEKKPILSYINNSSSNMSFEYVTFTVKEQGMHHIPAEARWRLELPPVLEKPLMKRITGGEPRWIRASNQLPDGALIGGYENETLYIMRAHHRGALTPGKFIPSVGVGAVPWGGESHVKEEFEILCGYDCIWVPTFGDNIPVGAVEGGYSQGDLLKLYIGRAMYKGHLIPGKVQPIYKLCYIPFEGREIEIDKYEILVCPYINSRSATRLYTNRIHTETPPESESEEDDDDNMDLEEDNQRVLEQLFELS